MFSYNSNIARPLDKVRFAIGDTDAGNPQLQDEEILFLLADEPGYLDAAISAADALAAKYARQVDYAAGPIRESLMQLQTSYQMLADRLRRKIARRGIAPYLGGVSLSERDTQELDTAQVQPIFRVGQDSEPGTNPDTDSGPIAPWPWS